MENPINFFFLKQSLTKQELTFREVTLVLNLQELPQHGGREAHGWNHQVVQGHGSETGEQGSQRAKGLRMDRLSYMPKKKKIEEKV